MNIIEVNQSNLKDFTELSVMLFPEETFEKEYEMYKESFKTEKEFGFLYQKDNKYTAMLHLSIRYDYVNGTSTSPVAYLEAIYVLPEYRKQGIGKELVTFAEEYARQKGITQLASDCLTDNYESENFHKNCGFTEEERIICFVKDI